MATPKGLTRKITRKQALSYERLTPNAIGVTAISSVNGRGAYGRAIRETRSARGAFGPNRKRSAPKRGRRYGKNQPLAREPFRMVVGVEHQDIRPSRRAQAAMKRAARQAARRPAGKRYGRNQPFRPISAAERLAERSASGYERALRPLKKVRHAGERVIDAARGGYQRAYQRTRQLLGGRTVRRARVVGVPVIGLGADTAYTVRRRRTRRAATTETKMRKGRKLRGKKKTAFLRRMAAGRRAAARRSGTATSRPRRRSGKKRHLSRAHLQKMLAGARRYRLKKGYKGNKGKRKAAKRPRRARRAYTPVTVRIGKRSARTYLYRTRRGGVKHMPLWMSSGARSARQFAAATRPGTAVAGTKAGARIRKRVASIMRARQRSAARVARAGDIFTPNRGRAIPFTTWSESMHRNKKRKHAKRSRKSAARKPGTKLTKRQRAARRGVATRRRHKRERQERARKAARKRSRKGTRRMHKNRRRHVRRFEENRRRRRRARPNRRRHARRFEENRRRRRARPNRRRRHARRYDENRRRRTRRHHRNARRRSYLPIHVSRMHPLHFEENRRRSRRRRSYRRNFGGAFWNRFVGMLKIGALAGVGFMGHRALTKIVSGKLLSQVPQLSTGTLAPYKDVISGLLVAAAGMFAVDKFAKKQAAEVNAGIFVSLVQSVVVTVLTQLNQPAVAAALSGYPDAEGRAYRGFGEYVPVSGFGDLPARSRYGGRMLAQAAAGYGAVPMLTQAAAGYGAVPQLTQAAAGVGEYVAQGVEGIGDYEMVAGMGASELTSEGIRPDLASAEQALDIAEAAAGLGDIGTRSQLNPAMVTQSIAHQPGGMRAAIFSGGDGIFSK